ncbi:hypothetical protein J4233_04140 [Candidatus Pacearchaeota archaeon]|nr:hypothetical protein [Candidatus Pacearchaeota archaeon]
MKNKKNKYITPPSKSPNGKKPPENEDIKLLGSMKNKKTEKMEEITREVR